MERFGLFVFMRVLHASQLGRCLCWGGSECFVFFLCLSFMFFDFLLFLVAMLVTVTASLLVGSVDVTMSLIALCFCIGFKWSNLGQSNFRLEIHLSLLVRTAED